MGLILVASRISTPERLTPPTRITLQPPLAGAFVSVTEPHHETPADTDTPYFLEPTSGLALRNPYKRDSATSRGSRVFGNVDVSHESDIERYSAAILWARSDTQELHAQYPCVVFFDGEGVRRHHTFDRFVVRKDGRKVAYALKSSTQSEELDEKVKRMRAAGFVAVEGGGSVIDEAFIMTEEEASEELYQNALNVLRARTFEDRRDYDLVLDMIARMPGRFRFGELLKGAIDLKRRRMAIWNAIGIGRLEPCAPERVFDHTFLAAPK